MRRQNVGIFVLTLFLAGLAAIAINDPAEAAVEPTLDVQAEKEAAIDDIYRDFLDRPATQPEIDRFMGRLGVRQSLHDVRFRVLASRAFLEEVAGGTRGGFVRAAYEQALGRPPTDDEFAQDLQFVARNETHSYLRLRQLLANRLLDRANYDPDGLGVREVVLHYNDAGDIERFAFEIDAEFERADNFAIAVGYRKQDQSGSLGLRPGLSTVSFIPDEPLPLGGRLVGMVFVDTGDGVKIADLRTPSRRLPPRTSDFSDWPDEVFADQRIIAYYGNHLTPLLGVLGETGPEAAVTRVKAAAAPFDTPDKRAVGAFEMIVTVAQRSAGFDGNYSHPSNLEDVEAWIDIAEANGLYVILDIQPGTSDFLTESVRYESLLMRPNVGLALDPEWRMRPGQRPGSVVGQVSAAEVNQVSEWLSNLVVDNNLPEKIFMVHQFQERMITNRDDLVDRPGLATVIHADGFGGREIKLATYSRIKVEPPFYNGFKLFIDEDTRMFQPADLLAFDEHPVPDFVSYQ